MKNYSPRFEQALRTAFRLHKGQKRKSDPDLPYTTHLVHVTFLLSVHGFEQDILIAALLHDAIEDTEYTAEELAAEFGEEICHIVMEVTENKALRWEARKAAYIETIRGASIAGKAICCADKIHNLSSILEAEARQGDALWRVFSRGKEQTYIFYASALEAIGDGWSHPIIDTYRDVLRRAGERWGLM